MLNNFLRKASHSVAKNHLKKTFSLVQNTYKCTSKIAPLAFFNNTQRISSNVNNKNIRYFSDSNKDPKKEDNEKKDTKKDDDSENLEDEEEKKEQTMWEEFTSYFKNDKDSSGKSKKDGKKGSFFDGGPE